MQTKTVPITPEEMERLMEVIELSSEYDFMLFTVLKTTGRRIGELFGIQELEVIGRKKVGQRTIFIDGKATIIDKVVPRYKKGKWILGLKVKDIDFEKNVMKVWVLKRRDYVQDETILTPEAARLIKKYIAKNRLTLNDYVFRKRTPRGLNKRLEVYAKKADIEHAVSLHNFRHYLITELKRRGWTNDKIAKLTGHKSLATLTIYDHIIATDIKDELLDTLKDI